MTLVLGAVLLLLAGGVLALGMQRSARSANLLGAGSALLAGALGAAGAARILLTGTTEGLRQPWPVPYGSFSVAVDPLAALFLLLTFLVAGLAALYGSGYLAAHAPGRSLGPPWFFFNLLVASIALVLLAANAVLFLVAWEVMTLAAFFLVTFEDEREETRRAGLTFLVASHVGTAFLVAFFLLLGRGAATLDFSDLLRARPAATADLLFLLALFGFGTKAGLVPLHVWLPEAHPAAPSHVSAVMSGAMVKTGIYGLLRAIGLIGTPPPAWGYALVCLGLVSAVLGILLALAQSDLKRRLAYSTVENLGIVAAALGVGLLGVSFGSPAVAALGFAGGLLHALHHAVFKGLLFLAAGSVAAAAGTRDLDRLGGLLRRMPTTGTCFLIASLSVCALPPSSGFLSEWLILVAAYHGWLEANAAPAIAFAAVIALLGLASGLALAGFAGAFGVAFLGSPRGDGAARAKEAGRAMRVAMVALAAVSILLGLLAPLLLPVLAPALPQGLEPALARAALARASSLLGRGLLAGLGALVLGALLLAARRRLLSGRPQEAGLTWDCGYAHPTASMQYTATSFARPLLEVFQALVRTRRQATIASGVFPATVVVHSQTPDLILGLYGSAFAAAARALSHLRRLQSGRVHTYVLYVALTLLALLLWQLG